MANTYTKIYIQIVFAVKGRQNLISQKYRNELYKYITGIVKNHNQKLICINGMSDHIHLLIGIKPDMNISTIAKAVKANSSRFINEKGWVAGEFEWQKGYGAFSYSHSQLDNIYQYIMNQEKHHKKMSFKEEYITLLKKFEIDFDEKYIFTFG
jgi:putative transposase